MTPVYAVYIIGGGTILSSIGYVGWVVVMADTTSTPTTLLGLLGVLATGVSALLGIVVKWLLAHITNLTTQVMTLIESRDKVTAEIQKGYKDSLVLVVDHCDKEIERQVDVQRDRDAKVEVALNRYAEAVEELRDVVAALHARILQQDK